MHFKHPHLFDIGIWGTVSKTNNLTEVCGGGRAWTSLSKSFFIPHTTTPVVICVHNLAQHHELFKGETVRNCALSSPYVQFIALRQQRHAKDTELLGRDQGGSRMQRGEAMVARSSLALWVWLCRTSMNTFLDVAEWRIIRPRSFQHTDPCWILQCKLNCYKNVFIIKAVKLRKHQKITC